MSIEKIHRAAPLGSRREDGQLFGLSSPAPGLVFLPVLPGGVPAAAPVPSYQQPDPEQLFPVSTPAAILPAIHPVTPPPPVTFRLPATQPRTIVRVITQIRCGPGNSQFAAGTWTPEQFIGLLPSPEESR